ncbi:acetyl-CoA carboxylase biotin carboxylase subunit family protein [Streptomyces sp. NPDC059785]|uniref:ATP-grasp domain-containing protein n=1 Tax=Streptomyces sp. NPDC059785 TaxID=3346945 RepID=UPI003668631D
MDPFYVVPTAIVSAEKPKFRRVADMENVQEVLRAVLAEPLDELAGVLSVHEMGVFPAACLRRQLGLPGNADARKVLNFRDKRLQKSLLPPDVRHARCRYLPAGTPYEEPAAELGTPFVVKPATGAGAQRTSVVRSPEEYARALKPFSGGSDVEVVAESFVDAPEVYLDGVWQHGTLQWSSLSSNHISPLSAVQGGVLAAHVLDRQRCPDLFAQAEAMARRVLGALDAPDCVFHMEAFHRPDGLTFGECAVRLPGALSPRVNQLTYGVDLLGVEIALALGETPEPPYGHRTPDRFHGYLLLRRPRVGTLTQEDFERAFSFDELHYSADPDAPAGPYGRIGEAVVSDTDESRLGHTIDEIARFNETGGVRGGFSLA